jgi:peroxiredoxin
MSLQDGLDILKADFEGKAPAEALAIMRRVTDELIASGQAERALKAGDRAPAFTLPNSNDKPVALTDMLAKGPLVVTFYRGVWCPYCNLDLQALEAAAGEIRSRGGLLVAISPQTTANSRKSQRNNHLSFPILSDKGSDVAAAFGIRWMVPDDLREVYKQLGSDLPAFNGEQSWTLPMPARYVIDQDGIIAYAEINPDYKQRPEPSDVFATLDGLQRSQDV